MEDTTTTASLFSEDYPLFGANSTDNYTLLLEEPPINHDSFGHTHIFPEPTSGLVKLVLAGVLLTAAGAFGVVGNVLSILVLSQRKIHASLTVLLINLSICDLLVCVLLPALRGLPTMFEYFHIGTGYLGLICVPKKYLFPLHQTVQLGSTYFTVAITLERFIAVAFPLRSRSICTYKNSRRVSLAILLFVLLSNGLVFYTTAKREEIYHPANMTCVSGEPMDIPDYVNHIKLGIYVVVHYLLPLVTVIFVNVIIIKKVQTNNTKRRGSITQNHLKEIRLTKMLVIVVVVYVICNVFRVVNAVTSNVFGVNYGEIVALTEFLVVFNSAVNYIIYCAYGKHFRQGFIRLFCYSGRRNRNSFFGSSSRRGEDETNNVTEMTIVQSMRRLSKGIIQSLGKTSRHNSNHKENDDAGVSPTPS